MKKTAKKTTKKNVTSSKKTLVVKSGVKAGPHFRSFGGSVYHYQAVGEYNAN